MKKIIILLICVFSLTSCFSHKNTEDKNAENTETNSGSIEKLVVTDNTTQTGSENTEKQEEKNLPTEYEVTTEKSYFYNNPDDTEPRKAYVMKGDVVKIIPEKSTENMFFAVYTNSSGKTTEGYLKKFEVTAIENSALKQEKISITSNCKRVYDFSVGHDDTIIGNRKFEFNFVGDCAEQKNPLNIGIYDVSDVKIGLATGQKGYFMNWMHTMDTGWGFSCEIKNPLFSTSFDTGEFHIVIKAGKEICTTGFDEDKKEQENYNINIEVSEKGKGKIFEIFFRNIPKQVLEQNYNDLLWTMKNGFFEKGKKVTKGTMNESRIDMIKIHQIEGTKNNLEKWEFTENLSAIFFDNIYIPTGIDKVIQNYTETIPCNEDRGRKIRNCKVTKIDGKFIFWEHFYGEFFQDLENDYYQEIDTTEYYKTNIITEKTELLKKEETKNCMIEGGKKIMCHK